MKDHKILVIGNSYPFIKKLKTYTENIFVAPGNSEISKIAECVDIRENDVDGLLEFAVKNDINFTIVLSDKAIKADIYSYFSANEKLIFSPSAASAEFVLSKAAGKKFLYKLHAKTPKFGIFEKQQLAFDYIKDATFPLVISADAYDACKFFCTTPERAKFHVEDLFLSGETKVVIEEFVSGHEFTMYFVSDGYHALPLNSVRTFKFTENGDGGILTSGVGSYCPDDRVSDDVQTKIYNEVVLNGLKYLEKGDKSYCGILGVEGVLTSDDSFSILNFKPFMSDFDAQAILNSVDENLLELFEACANGSFSDEYDEILTNDNVSVSCVLKSRKDKFGLPDEDLISSDCSVVGNNIILTSNAKTLSRAKKIIEDDVDVIKFDGMKVRSDIYHS